MSTTKNPTAQAAVDDASKRSVSAPAKRKRGIFTKIFLALAMIVAVLAVVVAIQPAEFRVERTATMAAPAPVVFAQVNDLHKWEAWSPWAKLDPAMKQSYSGASAGEGAVYEWNGNSEVGEGRTTITESREDELVKIKLEFVRPFACSNDVAFTFKPAGDQTAVTWAMSGHKNFMAKAIHLFINMDKMCGGQFEKGLADLKTVAESTPERTLAATAPR